MKIYSNPPWYERWRLNKDNSRLLRPTIPGKIIIMGVPESSEYSHNSGIESVYETIRKCKDNNQDYAVGIGHPDFTVFEDWLDPIKIDELTRFVLNTRPPAGEYYFDIEPYKLEGRRYHQIDNLWRDGPRLSEAWNDFFDACRGLTLYIEQGHPNHLLPYLMHLSGLKIVIHGSEIKHTPYVDKHTTAWTSRLEEVTAYWRSLSITYEPVVNAGTLCNPMLMGRLLQESGTGDFAIFFSGDKTFWSGVTREHYWYFQTSEFCKKIKELVSLNVYADWKEQIETPLEFPVL